MFRLIFQLFLAGGIATAILLWVTGNDTQRVREAIQGARDFTSETKERRDVYRDESRLSETVGALKSTDSALAEADVALEQAREAIRLARQKTARLQDQSLDETQEAELALAVKEELDAEKMMTEALQKADQAVKASQGLAEKFQSLTEEKQAKALELAAVETEQNPAVSVVVETFQTQNLSDEIRLTGRTLIDQRVDVMAETSGRVIDSRYKKGDRVRRGDVLCRLDIGDRIARREQAEAQLRQALIDERAQVALSERGYAAANRARTATTTVESARASIEQIDVDIQRTEIRAPFSGEILNKPAEIGALLQPGALCATIVNPDPMLLLGFLTERDINRVREGRQVSGTLPDGRRVRGQVTHIARAGDVSTRTFEVEIAVPNPDYSIREGQTVNIEIPIDPMRAVRVPQSALSLDDAGRIGLKLAQNGRVVFQEVSILKDGAEGVWVAGAPQNPTVIVVGQEFVTDGGRIRPVDRKTLGRPEGASL